MKRCAPGGMGTRGPSHASIVSIPFFASEGLYNEKVRARARGASHASIPAFLFYGFPLQCSE